MGSHSQPARTGVMRRTTHASREPAGHRRAGPSHPWHCRRSPRRDRRADRSRGRLRARSSAGRVRHRRAGGRGSLPGGDHRRPLRARVPTPPPRSSRSCGSRLRLGAVLLGPNCLGLVDTSTDLQLSHDLLPPGEVAVLSQSGNLALDLASLLAERGLGVSRFVSLGNQADLTVVDLMDGVRDHDATRAVAVYVEDVAAGRRLIAAARRLRLAGKPVVLLAPGRSAAAVRGRCVTHRSLDHRVLRSGRRLRGGGDPSGGGAGADGRSAGGVGWGPSHVRLPRCGSHRRRWARRGRGGRARGGRAGDAASHRSHARDFADPAARELVGLQPRRSGRGGGAGPDELHARPRGAAGCEGRRRGAADRILRRVLGVDVAAGCPRACSREWRWHGQSARRQSRLSSSRSHPLLRRGGCCRRPGSPCTATSTALPPC